MRFVQLRVGILAYEGCWAMGLFSVTDFFRVASLLEKHLGLTSRFTVEVVSVDGKEVKSAAGYGIKPDAAITLDRRYDLIVVPPIEGPRLALHGSPDSRIVQWLSRRLAEQSDLLALTTGAFMLAATGLANDIPIASHWAFISHLKQTYPNCTFVSHQSFLQHNHVYTTGSLQGGFDALLEWLAKVRGDRFSQLCAAHLLVSDPAKLSPILPGYRNHNDAAVLKVQDWIESNYKKPMTVRMMSEVASLTERTLARRFQASVGVSLTDYMQRVRVDKAKKLLITSNLSVTAVSYEVGYENVGFFIRLFKKHVNKTPGEWRIEG